MYYNKNVKTQTVATFIQLSDWRGEPRNPVSRLFAADGSLLYVMNCDSRHDDHVRYTNNPINILKCYMYHLLGKNSREGYTFASIPLSRGAGDRLFNHHRL